MAVHLVHIHVEIVPDPETVHSVGVNLALRQPCYFRAVDGKDHAIAIDLDAQRVGLPAVRPLLDDRRMSCPVHDCHRLFDGENAR